MHWKRLIRSGFERLGLEVRVCRSHHTDLWGDEQRLLAGEPVRTVFDVGASYGDTVGKFRARFPDADVYGFEPTEGPFRAASTRFANDPKVRLVRAAVGERPGEATLHMNVFDQTNSLLPIDPAIQGFLPPGQGREVGSAPVPVVTLDDFCADRGVGSIDVLKMDIQGFELHALKGARRLLEGRAIRLIATEVLFTKMYQGQTYYHEIATHLAGFGYELWGLYEMIRGKDGPLAHGDAIFLRPGLRKT